MRAKEFLSVLWSHFLVTHQGSIRKTDCFNKFLIPSPMGLLLIPSHFMIQLWYIRLFSKLMLQFLKKERKEPKTWGLSRHGTLGLGCPWMRLAKFLYFSETCFLISVMWYHYNNVHLLFMSGDLAWNKKLCTSWSLTLITCTIET
jgi:hypothetical protein